MACKICKREYKSTLGCNPYIVRLRGKDYPSIPFKGPGDKYEGDSTETTCPDCGTPEGKTHHSGCDIERCPVCKGQMLMCGGCGGKFRLQDKPPKFQWRELTSIVASRELCEQAKGLFDSTALVYYPIYDDGFPEWVVGEAREILESIEKHDDYFLAIAEEIIPAPTRAEIEEKLPTGLFLLPMPENKYSRWCIGGDSELEFTASTGESAEDLGLRYLLSLQDRAG